MESRSREVKILAQRTRLWLSPEGICYIGSFKNHKYQITNNKQITKTEIRKSKQCLVREGFGHAQRRRLRRVLNIEI
jgi:hypothetical protein